MASKPSKLAGFAAKPAASRSRTAPQVPATKGRGKTIGVTLRFNHDDWLKLRQYALDRLTSTQRIALLGCSKILDEEGLGPLKGASAS